MSDLFIKQPFIKQISIKLLSGVLIMAALSACSEKSEPTATDKMMSQKKLDSAGPFKVDVVVNPQTPTVGKNAVTITIKDENNQPVNNASIKAVAVMPSMGSMPAMYAPAEMQATGSGVYEGEFEPSMSGEWPLTIKIESPDIGTGSITYDLATGRKGLRCANCKDNSESSMPSIQVDNYRRQLIGVTTASVNRQPLIKNIRAVGSVTYDETRLSDVTLKFNGWIGKLHANYTGIAVNKGDPLFTVYSPELLAAQEEYLETYRRTKQNRANRLLQSAKRKLTLWNLSQQQIHELEKDGKASEYITIYSPASGVVITKNIVEGAAVKAGDTLYRIADVSRVWVEAQIYDYELPLVNTGMAATVTLPELQDREFNSRVSYLSPFMQGDTRTARARVELQNSDGFLRPDMYATINLKADLGERLVVPESAVLYAGQARVVFVDLGEGRLQPRRIKTGYRNRDVIEVLEGLSAGDTVVTSGNFLIASEAKLKLGDAQW